MAAHASWDPSLNKDGSVKEFRTGPEAEYPAEWCQLFPAAIVAEEACDLKKAGNFIFSEVFSGPAAPLTQAFQEELRKHNFGAEDLAASIGPSVLARAG